MRTQRLRNKPRSKPHSWMFGPPAPRPQYEAQPVPVVAPQPTGAQRQASAELLERLNTVLMASDTPRGSDGDASRLLFDSGPHPAADRLGTAGAGCLHADSRRPDLTIYVEGFTDDTQRASTRDLRTPGARSSRHACRQWFAGRLGSGRRLWRNTAHGIQRQRQRARAKPSSGNRDLRPKHRQHGPVGSYLSRYRPGIDFGPRINANDASTNFLFPFICVHSRDLSLAMSLPPATNVSSE